MRGQSWRAYGVATFCVGALIIGDARAALAGVPQLINYQGILLDGVGDPVITPTSVLFAIWDDVATGDSMWSEIQLVTPSTTGEFNVLLGSTTPIPDSAFAGGEAYLSVKVGSDAELSPRARLVSVGYSFRTRSVDGALGGRITTPVVIGMTSTNDGLHSFAAGDSNIVQRDWSFIGGGFKNRISFDYGAITGGLHNYAHFYSFVGGGRQDSARANFSVVVGGDHNTTASGATNAAILGGTNNRANGTNSVVGGGASNTADALGSTVSGGTTNGAFGSGSTVAGGLWDTASGEVSAVSGGRYNTASGDWSFVGGGWGNKAQGDGAVVAGGGQLGGASNIAEGLCSAILGGLSNSASGEFSSIGGGQNNTAAGDSATVSGGSSNNADSLCATVGGGQFNRATSSHATIGGGWLNLANGLRATIAGGQQNTASDRWTAIGGGEGNVADGWYATVPGGWRSAARGDVSVGLGGLAKANHAGAVVIVANSNIGNLNDTVASSADEQMVLRADGGFYLTNVVGTASIPAGQFLRTSTGAHLTTGGVWTNSSDADKKENFRRIDPEALLSKVAELRISEWNYKDDADAVRHIGPTAQEFHALFGLGCDSVSISTVDPSGVALAAIQALHAKTPRNRRIKRTSRENGASAGINCPRARRSVTY